MQIDRTLADMKIAHAINKVQEWGKTMMPQQPWDSHSWHLLGHALKCAHEATEADPTYQRSWTLLADILHLIGKEDYASYCLAKSYILATPGPKFPGKFYGDVKRRINSGYPFNNDGCLIREESHQWFDEKYERYWLSLDILLKMGRDDSFPKVLISYAREDAKKVECLETDLQKYGVVTWKDTHSIPPGVDWKKRIKKAFCENDFILLCFSSVSVSKVGFFQVEVKEAVDRQKYYPDSRVYLIPVKLEPCAVPAKVLRFQCVDLYPEWKEGVGRIVASILQP